VRDFEEPNEALRDSAREEHGEQGVAPDGRICVAEVHKARVHRAASPTGTREEFRKRRHIHLRAHAFTEGRLIRKQRVVDGLANTVEDKLVHNLEQHWEQDDRAVTPRFVCMPFPLEYGHDDTCTHVLWEGSRRDEAVDDVEYGWED
jgi:hypothetical protein